MLEGEELAQFWANEREEKARKATEAALIAKGKLMLEESESEDSEEEVDGLGAPVRPENLFPDVMPTKQVEEPSLSRSSKTPSGKLPSVSHMDQRPTQVDTGFSDQTFDMYVRDATKSGGFFKTSRTYQMFPMPERKRKVDDYGEAINLNHFLRTSLASASQSAQGL